MKGPPPTPITNPTNPTKADALALMLGYTTVCVAVRSGPNDTPPMMLTSMIIASAMFADGAKIALTPP